MESTNQNKDWEIQLFDKVIDEDKEYEQYSEDFFGYLADAAKGALGGNRPRKVLEAGCGTGTLGKRLLRRFRNLKITGVDISPNMVRLANDGTKSYKAIRGNLEDEGLFAAGSFDAILCGFILHHFPSCRKIVSNCARWLKKGGYVIIAEPNGSSPVNKVSKAARHGLERIFGKDWVVKKRLATPNETDHTVDTYRKLLEQNGFEVVFLRTEHFGSQKISLRSIGGLKEAGYRLCDKAFGGTERSGSSIIIIARKT